MEEKHDVENQRVDEKLLEVTGVDWSLFPEIFHYRYCEAARTYPHLVPNMPEEELLEKIKRPTALQNQLRLRLWYEYDNMRAIRATGSERGAEKARGYILSIDRICAGLCTNQFFYHRMKKEPEFTIFLFTRPLSYDCHIEEMLNFGSRYVRKIMNMDDTEPVLNRMGQIVYDKDGKEVRRVNTKIMNMKISLYLAAEMRKFGGIPQITKNLNLTQTVVEKETAQVAEQCGEELMLRELVHLKTMEKAKASKVGKNADTFAMGVLPKGEGKVVDAEVVDDKEDDDKY